MIAYFEEEYSFVYVRKRDKWFLGKFFNIVLNYIVVSFNLSFYFCIDIFISLKRLTSKCVVKIQNIFLRIANRVDLLLRLW